MRRAVVLALPVVGLLLAGCGGGGSSSTTTAATTTTAAALPPAKGPAATTLAKAVAATRATGSQHVALTGAISSKSVVFDVRGSGGYDETKKAGTMNVKLVSPSGSIPIQEIFSGDTIWLASSLLATALSPGKSWLELNLATDGAAPGFDFKALTGQTPGDALSLLTYASSVTSLGTATVAGKTTTHYRVTVDPARVAAGDPNEADTHARYTDVEAWVGADGTVAQVRMVYTARLDPSQPALAHIELTMGLSDDGVAVSATPPPAAQVDSGSSSLGTTTTG